MYLNSLVLFHYNKFIGTSGSGKARDELDHPVTLVLQLHQSPLWHYRLWSFQGRDTKLERFLHKNQLQSNEIIEF